MRTKVKYESLKGLLDREFAIAESKELTNEWSSYLEELVNYATKLLGRCETSLKNVPGTPATLIHLYYHMIQMADGIQVLCSQACFAACIPLLRSLWEGVLSIEYILKSDFDARSTAWLTCGHLEGKEYWELQYKSSNKGKEVVRHQRTDKYFSKLELGEKDPEVVRRQIRLYEEILNKPKFRASLSKLSKDALKKKKWYSVNGGANSVWSMAEDLDRALEYYFLYSKYSAISHAKDSRRMLSDSTGIVSFEPIRSLSSAIEAYSFTCGYLMEATLMMWETLRPGENVPVQLREIIVRHGREARD